jgi:hypothetical protein
VGNRGRATFAKRQREIARQERAREKAAKRVERKETRIKLDRTGDDPDIAGIVPGPQPRTYDLPDEQIGGAEQEQEQEQEQDDR